MLALAFTFPAGKYHATPWDRHVNEGAVVWPPEPWRVLRALIATWHHKIKHAGRYEEATLAALIESLSQDLPEYKLPVASHSHTRHYMPQWKAGDTSLVFDAFAAVDRNEPLIMAWRTLELPDPQLALLDDLLAAMSYLGRAESWVEAGRFELKGDLQPDCVPGGEALDKVMGELSEVVTLLAPLPLAEYRELRKGFIPDNEALGRTLPADLLDALSVETTDLRKQGWSQPPAARKVSYLRPVDALRPKRTMHKATPPPTTTARFVLVGKPLPRVEDSVRIGELLRQAVMSEAKKQLGENAIPPMLSGHGVAAGQHHAFYLPWDANGDGFIDRLIVHLPHGMGSIERRIVENLRRLWSRDIGEWPLVLEGIDGFERDESLLAETTQWQSVTPYLHPWHVKKHFDVQAQIRRECLARGVPEPQLLEPLPSIHAGAQARKPIHFHRFRSKRGLSQPDRLGSFWRLTFAKPVRGPLALGFGCHYGLGLFEPVKGTSRSGDECSGTSPNDTLRHRLAAVDGGELELPMRESVRDPPHFKP